MLKVVDTQVNNQTNKSYYLHSTVGAPRHLKLNDYRRISIPVLSIDGHPLYLKVNKTSPVTLESELRTSKVTLK